jgi:hypothetical protein
MYLDNRGTLAPFRAYNVRRREPRYVYSVPVVLERFLRYGPVVTRGVTLDISMRGMSALVCGAPRVGETVIIKLSLQYVPVEMLATVHHSSDAKSGFEFYPMSPVAQQGIQDWIQELTKHEESPFPNPYTSAVKVASD